MSLISSELAEAGDRDGPADHARFSGPRGVAVTYEPVEDWGQPAALVLYVADTGNHRIRRIRLLLPPPRQEAHLPAAR